MLPSPHSFLHQLLTALRKEGIPVEDLELDHLCYRVDRMERYHAMKEVLARHGRLLGEHVIGGRPIATYALAVPIVFEERRIHVVELPAPKPGSPYAEGWEHAEFVVPEALETFMARSPLAQWDVSDLHKPVNADVRLRSGGISAKFHRQALADVIAAEQAGG